MTFLRPYFDCMIRCGLQHQILFSFLPTQNLCSSRVASVFDKSKTHATEKKISICKFGGRDYFIKLLPLLEAIGHLNTIPRVLNCISNAIICTCEMKKFRWDRKLFESSCLSCPNYVNEPQSEYFC